MPKEVRLTATEREKIIQMVKEAISAWPKWPSQAVIGRMVETAKDTILEARALRETVRVIREEPPPVED